LYALEYAHARREKLTCTSLPNAWLPTYTNNAPHKEVRHYDFTSAKAKRLDLEAESAGALNQPQCDVPNKKKNLPTVSQERYDQFLRDVFQTDGDNCAVFRVAKDFCDFFKTKDLVSVPPPLTVFFYASICDKNDDEINRKCEEVWQGYNLSKEQCASIEEATRGQSKSAQWHSQRLGRITASKTKRICSDDLANPSLSLLKDVCYSTQTYQSGEMKRGLRMEKVALAAYQDLMRQHHGDFKVNCNPLSFPYF